MAGANRSSDSDDVSRQLTKDADLFHAVRKRPRRDKQYSEKERCQEIDEILIDGANVNALDAKGNTVLHIAVKKGYLLVIDRLLMEKALNISIRNCDGKTPVDLGLFLEDQNIIAAFETYKRCKLDVKVATSSNDKLAEIENLFEGMNLTVREDLSLFLSIALAFLMPSLNNAPEFRKRFEKLFDVDKDGKIEKMHEFLSGLNFCSSDVVDSCVRSFEQMIETIFREKVLGEISCQVEDRSNLKYNRNEPELLAVSKIIDATIYVQCDKNYSQYGGGINKIFLSCISSSGGLENGWKHCLYKIDHQSHIHNIDAAEKIPDATSSNTNNTSLNLEQRNSTFIRRQGTSGIGGQLYEIELLTFFLLQGVVKKNEGKICSFHLATNVKQAGDFDDLVFKYQYQDIDGHMHSKLIFLQAKHKENPGNPKEIITVEKLLSESEKGDFNLKNYFSCYRRLAQNFSEDKTSDPIFGCNFADLNCDFIIYTNALAKFSRIGDVEKVYLSEDDFLNFEDISDCLYYRINVDKCLSKKVFDVLSYSSDCLKLAKELVKSIFSVNGLNVDSGILKSYHGTLVNEIIELDRGELGNGKLQEKFLNGECNDQFKKAFFYEIRKREEFSNKPTVDIKSDLLSTTFKLPNNFGNIKEKFVKLELPNDSVTEKEVIDFLRKLKLFVCQPGESYLSKLIERKIQVVYSMNPDDASLVIADVKNKIQKWWKEGNWFLTEHDRLFEDAKQDLSKLSLVGLALERKGQIEKLDIRFKREQIEVLTRLISEKQIINIVTEMSTHLLSSIKVYQALESMNEYQSMMNKFRYIFMHLSTLFSLQSKVINAFESKQNVLLVIECNLKNENINTLYGELFPILLSQPSKKIVLITRECQVLSNKLKVDFPTKYTEKEDTNSNLVDLTIESQDRLLLEGIIVFQGIDVNLCALVNEESKKLIDGEILSKLVICEKVEVGNAVPNLGDVKYYYIDRTLNYHIKIKEIFRNEFKFFIITDSKSAPLTYPQNEQDIVVISDEISHFKELTRKYKSHDVHWLKQDGGDLIWQQSHGSPSKLSEYIDEYSFKRFEPENILDISDKVVILAAEPGMGKSTLLTYLAEQTKFANPSLWIVKINLSRCTSILSQMHFDDSVEHAFNFILTVIKPKTVLEIELFRNQFFVQGKIALLFDAFDEISPIYKEKVICLLQILKNTKIEKIWVSTRLHIRNELESRLSLFAYTLKPFSRFDQEKFLQKFWGKYLSYGNVNESRLNIFIESLLNLLSNSIRDKERQFTSVPLQTELLARAFQETLRKFHDSPNSVLEPDLPKKLDVLDLYKRFVDSKYGERYLLEKRKFELTQAGTEYETLHESFIKKHKLLSLSALFSEETTNKLLSDIENVELKRYKQEVEIGKENIGFIYQIEDGEPNFIHRTFAEYFVAQLFSEKLGKLEVNDFLRDQIFKEENEVIRNFFDRLMAKDDLDPNKYELHIAVINNDRECVVELLNRESANNLVNSIDKAGRTALHLAAAYGYENLVSVLLERDANIHVTDIFNWSPLSYADNVMYWNIAEMLLKNGADASVMVQAFVHAKSPVASGKLPLLHEAAMSGYIELAKSLIELGEVDVNLKDFVGTTPLHVAAFHKQLDIVKYLIKKGAKINAMQYGKNSTPLHSAIYGGDIQIIDFLVCEKADISQSSRYMSPLHMAISKSNMEAISYLLNRGAPINQIDYNGNSPLHQAARNGNIDIVAFLVKMGAELNIKNEDGDTPLHSSAEFERWEIVKYLAEAGADINLPNQVGRTLKYLVATSGKTSLLKYLGGKGVDFNVADRDGCTALHAAALHGNLKVVKYLAGIGANVNAGNNNGMTPLHIAVSNGHLNITKYLTDEQKADFTIRNNFGSTPLHFAAKLFNWAIFEYLVSAGANFKEADDRDGCNPLHWAALVGKLDIVDLLVSGGSALEAQDHYGRTALHEAAFNGYMNVIEYLVSKGASISARDDDDCLPLHRATLNGHLHIVKYLIDNNLSEVNAKTKDGLIPLHYASSNGKLEVAVFLVSKGAEYNACDENGRTALHNAIRKADFNMAEFLITKGASVNMPDIKGITPLHIAATKNKLDLVEYLYGKGAYVNAEAGDAYFNKSPLDFAENFKVKIFLESKGAVSTRKKCNINCLRSQNGITVFR